jgi:hypothetical protein
MSRTSTYEIWAGMIARCHRVNDSEHYARYGARGITVCDRWRYSFENFLADMGVRPDGLSIERVDNDKGYSPENCVWATKVEQQRNRRSCRDISVNGVTKKVHKWAEETGMTSKQIGDRLRAGWTPEDAVGVPIGKSRSGSLPASGLKGVRQDYRGRWCATVWDGKKTAWIGFFDSSDQAFVAREEALRDLKKGQP